MLKQRIITAVVLLGVLALVIAAGALVVAAFGAALFRVDPALLGDLKIDGVGPEILARGPVVAAAVILDELQPIKGLGDSKVISPRRRERLFDEIRAKALTCCIAEATVEEIDQLNILQATLLAMRRAMLGLRCAPAQVQVSAFNNQEWLSH